MNAAAIRLIEYLSECGADGIEYRVVNARQARIDYTLGGKRMYQAAPLPANRSQLPEARAS